MISKLIKNITLLLFFLLIFFILVISTIGVETKRFNKLISTKLIEERNVGLLLNTVKFKLDLKKLSLFLETQNPQINYKNTSIPIETIKLYVDFLPLLKTELKVKKINITINKLDISDVNKFSKIIKPSNLKSFMDNKLKKGHLNAEVEIFPNEKGLLNNYIAKGDVQNFEANLIDELNLLKTSFSFILDKDDILIKNIFGKIENFEFFNGNININSEKGFKIKSNFDSNILVKEDILKKYSKYLSKNLLSNKIKSFNGKFNNNISIYFDETFKLIDFDYKTKGKIINTKFEINNFKKNSFFNEKIKDIYFSEILFESNISPKKTYFTGEGKYSLNNKDFLKFNSDYRLEKNLMNLNMVLDYKGNLNLNFINYKKKKESVAKLSVNLEKKNKEFFIKKFSLNDEGNLIIVKDLMFKNNFVEYFKKIEVKNANNDFYIEGGKKILLTGKKLDASNLLKFLNKKNKEESIIKKINSNIEINLKDVKIPLSEKLENFRLIGKIEKGKFVKISSKGDFGGGNFLDISMKKKQNSNKKYLEIYSDLTRPLLTEYKFFNGLSGGKLIFTSLIDGNKSNSKLIIEEFKMVNAPGLIKLLSLADLSGLADLAEGEGLSFDVLEINMEKDKDFLKLNEILALGPSMSVLMEGYQNDTGLTSLRGTLIPAKTLNKIISKIPVIGDIIIPKEIGEGLFGISFKMKGPKGNIKTTINPIRTLTPRFIQKIIDREKQLN